MRSLRILTVVVAAALAGTAAAQEAKSLDELLEQVRQGEHREREEDTRREAEFRAARDRQAALLATAQAEQAAEEKRSAALEQEFGSNEKTLPELQETMRERLGTLGELFGVVRQVAGDTLAFVNGSLVSAQVEDRGPVLRGLAESKELPSIEQLEKLWFVLQQEMTESGKVVPLRGERRGRRRNQRTSGRSSASARSTWSPADVTCSGSRKPASSPSWRGSRRARHLAHPDRPRGGDGRHRAASPSTPRAARILSLLIQTPDLRERLQQGGVVGYVIIALGLHRLRRRHPAPDLSVHRDATDARAGEPHRAVGSDNPLGRILAVYAEEPGRRTWRRSSSSSTRPSCRRPPRCERGNALIKVLSVVAPLLGLLGTVTGMIQTFQVITLFGTGDPKLMAGGISEALVTTVLGLIVAIPLVLAPQPW